VFEAEKSSCWAAAFFRHRFVVRAVMKEGQKWRATITYEMQNWIHVALQGLTSGPELRGAIISMRLLPTISVWEWECGTLLRMTQARAQGPPGVRGLGLGWLAPLGNRSV